ncbi:dihydroxyacetone kinase phosphoryl donor subunit DhaM [Streptococcus oricebi]|uniref:phosphoenolpyruvate--glycerone phosphotransferase n=1 Tax=Streptococcus oricebi TaxID=1547447 RepID=A0ABS5B210_9STRE|nr:dihydroxyacetone kinase phosphoryl donor subunit DhaM [Streptococcus oricebi]MBP2622876.1 PTS mannose family transporter subunit IIA [Streptococcus oricebi]
MEVGILIVSHSSLLAQGLFELIREVAPKAPIQAVGGLNQGEIGTSFERIQEAFEQIEGQQVLAFYDLGSARMNLEMLADFSDRPLQTMNVPLVEGSYTAAALVEAGASLEQIMEQLRELEIRK